jgi:hypothetical protein
MKPQKYTAGLWRTNNNCSSVCVDKEEFELVAIVYPNDLAKERERVANARLIAAAPELLECLHVFVLAVHTSPSLVDMAAVMKKAHNAILKATGGAE